MSEPIYKQLPFKHIEDILTEASASTLADLKAKGVEYVFALNHMLIRPYLNSQDSPKVFAVVPGGSLKQAFHHAFEESKPAPRPKPEGHGFYHWEYGGGEAVLDLTGDEPKLIQTPDALGFIDTLDARAG
jgi:hypothetical protein